MLRLAQLNMHSYHPKFMADACKDILNSASQMGISTSGIISLPTKKRRFSMLKGPFVHSKAIHQVFCARMPPRGLAHHPICLL